MNILASDYDGTIKIQNSISEEDRQAIEQFKNSGNVFGIVTGRTVGMIRNELKKFNLAYDFLICSNGGVILDGNGDVVRQINIDYQDALELIKFIQLDSRNMLGISNGIEFGTIQMGITDCAETPINELIETEEVDVKSILNHRVINSFFIRSRNERSTKQLLELCSIKFENRIQFHYNNGTIDATGWQVNKQSGVEYIEKEYKGKVFVIGDGHNDLPMIEHYQGFTLHHAPHEVIESASRVFSSVCEAIEWILKM